MEIILPGEVTEMQAQQMIEANFDRIAATIMDQIEADPKKKAALANCLNPFGFPTVAPKPSRSSTRRSSKQKKKSRR